MIYNYAVIIVSNIPLSNTQSIKLQCAAYKHMKGLWRHLLINWKTEYSFMKFLSY